MIERTLAIIKPDAWPKHGGEILTMATEAGLVPVEVRVLRLPVAEDGVFVRDFGWVKSEGFGFRSWSHFYAEHEGKPFFKPLVEFMASGPVLVMVLSGDHAISHWRELMGPTDSRKARPDTVRGRFGAHYTEKSVETTFHAVLDPYPMWRNAVHGSDSPEAAAREIAFFFGDA